VALLFLSKAFAFQSENCLISVNKKNLKKTSRLEQDFGLQELRRVTRLAREENAGRPRQREASHRIYQASPSSEGGSTSTPLFASPGSIVFAKIWLILVLWAFSPYAPGSLGSDQDTEMLNAILANPANPGINELYYCFFNFFATIPAILACLVLPQGRKGGIPAGPFLALSSAIGYFAMGPYLALRAPPVNSIEEKRGSVSWVTANVFENKAFNWFIFLFTLYLPVAADLLGALAADPDALWRGFLDIVSTSRFASVSLVDITLLYASSVYLTSRDYLLRKPDASVEEARAVAAATALVPVVGSALYCALRPKLPQPPQ
jgi:hypothetical protein